MTLKEKFLYTLATVGICSMVLFVVANVIRMERMFYIEKIADDIIYKQPYPLSTELNNRLSTRERNRAYYDITCWTLASCYPWLVPYDDGK